MLPTSLSDAKRARRVERHPGDGFLGRQAEQGAGHVHRQGRREQRRSAGVAVGGDGDRHLVLAEEIDRRPGRFLESVEGAGQEHGDRSGVGHRLGAGLVEMLEVIGRQRAILRGQLGAVLVGKLLGVELDPEAMPRAPP